VYRFYPLNVFSFLSLGRYPMVIRMLWHKIDCFNIHAVWAFRRFFKTLQPDIVWSHNLVGVGRLLRFAIPLNARWIHTLHDAQLLYPSGLLLYGHEQDWMNQGFVIRWYQAWMRWLLGSPSFVISPSRWLLEEHRREGFFSSSKVVVLPNQLTVNNQHPRKNKVPKKHLLFVGQLESHKGILFFLETLKRHFHKLNHESVVMDVVGDGSLEPKIAKLCSGDRRFVIHGRLDGLDYQSILHQADVVIVPSLCYENYPTIVAEALARGIPIVASRIGGIPEMIQEGVNGFLFEPNNETRCIEALNKAIEMPHPQPLSVIPKNPNIVINDVLQ